MFGAGRLNNWISSINAEFENPSDIRCGPRVSKNRLDSAYSHGVSETNQRVSDPSVTGWMEPVTQPETLFHSSLSFFRCFNAYLLTVTGVLGVLGK
ncbi:unnamed protein product [Rhizophagus irregularis]|nr:unnamed protein product [Rhizophagus irregularis]